jgi:serine/threonine protein kinase
MIEDQGQSPEGRPQHPETPPDSDNNETEVGVVTDPVDSVTCDSCGATIDTTGQTAFTPIDCPECSTANTVPARLGQFLLLKLLGTGGMGGVYYARDETLGRYVAIKVMLKSLGDDPEFIETFKSEAQAVARLNHPHIAQIYSFGQEKGQPYIVMELVNGERLDQMMEAATPINQGLVMRIGLEIAQGLSAADEAGLVHGDIKPENILLDKKGTAKLVDFGLASATDQAHEGGIWGTPYYIAPERVRKQAVDARSDIYSLGATLFHVITGHPPFDGETPVEVVKARLGNPAPPMSEYRKSLDPDVERIVGRMLEESLSSRYPNYSSLISDLKKVVLKLGGGKKPRSQRAKSIRIAKKSSSRAVTGAQTAVPTTSPPKGEAKSKIVVRKKTGGVSVSGRPATTARLTTTAVRVELSPEERAAREAKKKKARQRAITTTCIILGLVSIAAVVGTIIGLRQHKLNQRREWFALQGAITQGSNIYARIASVNTEIQQLSHMYTTNIPVLAEHVRVVSGMELVLPEPPVAAPPASTNATSEETADPGKDGPDGNADGTDAATDADAAAGSDADAEAVDTAADAADVPDALPVHDTSSPIASAAADAVASIYDLQLVAQNADELHGEAVSLRDSLLASRASTVAQSLTNQLGRVESRMLSVKDNADTRNASIVEHTSVVNELREAYDKAEQERIERERRIAEQARLEEERRLAEERRQQKIAAELAQVGAMTNSVKIDLNQNAFSKAHKEITEALQPLETDEGKAAMQVLADRYEVLIGLKAFLIERVNADPFAWGWIQEGGAGRDIVRANEKGLFVRGRATPVAWADVGPGQVLHMIAHYLKHPGTRASQRTLQSLAAAVFCFEHGTENSQKLALQYLDTALDLGYPAERARRLVPLNW